MCPLSCSGSAPGRAWPSMATGGCAQSLGSPRAAVPQVLLQHPVCVSCPGLFLASHRPCRSASQCSQLPCHLWGRVGAFQPAFHSLCSALNAGDPSCPSPGNTEIPYSAAFPWPERGIPAGAATLRQQQLLCCPVLVRDRPWPAPTPPPGLCVSPDTVTLRSEPCRDCHGLPQPRAAQQGLTLARCELQGSLAVRPLGWRSRGSIAGGSLGILGAAALSQGAAAAAQGVLL